MKQILALPRFAQETARSPVPCDVSTGFEPLREVEEDWGPGEVGEDWGDESGGPRPGRGHPGCPEETGPTGDCDAQGGVLDKPLGPVHRRPGIQPSSSGQRPCALHPAGERKPRVLEQ